MYRADQVGSLLRPSELLAARAAGVSGEQLKSLEDREVLRVLDRQQQLGFDVFTDGELRRTNFMSDFWDAVSGFDFAEAVPRKWDEGEQTESEAKVVSSVTGIVRSRLEQKAPLTGHELPFLKQHSPGPIKMTLPSATQFPAIAFRFGETDQVYPSPLDLLEDITRIMSADIAGICSSGISYLQIDAPRYSYFLDEKWCRWMEQELRVDTATMLTASLKADNACFAAARQPGVTRAIHLCRGNNRSHWYAEGGYDAIAEQLFNDLDVDRFLLEYDDARSGNFDPLRFVPKGKTVVLGLVSTKIAMLESKDDLLRRIDEAAKFLPLDQLALSPQCGFASTMEGNLLTEDDQWAKLKLIVDTAREVWQD